ncbi:MAG: hypothetical protein ABI861_06550 [Panacibacter sp.]
MSVWLQKAIDCLPELRKEYKLNELTIYTTFSEILHATVEAHKTNDEGRLRKFYDFAAWCFKQKDKSLRNAAGVSFYEHLGDRKETLDAIPKWIEKDIYKDVRALLEISLNETQLKQLDEHSYRI